MLVLDEADLLLSYGYNEDLQALAVHIPRSAQCILMSATASPELEQLQQLILHNPVTLNLLLVTHSGPQQPPSSAAGGDGGDAAAAAAAPAGGGGGLLSAGGAGSASEILHYALECAGGDRRLVVLGLLKLGLLRKKVRERVRGQRRVRGATKSEGTMWVAGGAEGLRLMLLCRSNSRPHLVCSALLLFPCCCLTLFCPHVPLPTHSNRTHPGLDIHQQC